MSHAEDREQNLDPREVETFARRAEDWWNEKGEFRPLHQMTPARIGLIRDVIAKRFGRDVKADRPLAGLTLLDIGCGGGLASEPLARLGAEVTGIDAASESIAVARDHAATMGLEIAYRAATAENLAREGARFDIVQALELIEHVPSAADFIATAATLVKPGGLLIVSTINRTLKALALAKLAAEYVLHWAPQGAHDYRKFVRPQELRRAMLATGLQPEVPRGLVYHPLKDDWAQSLDCDINYVMWANKVR